MALAPKAPESIETPPAEPSAPLPIGWNVLHEGTVLGTYLTETDANDYADQQPRAAGLTVEVAETKA